METTTKNYGYKIFATINEGNVKLYKDFELLPDRYIKVDGNEPTPIEDYGDWMLFLNEVTEEQAFQKFLDIALRIQD